MNKEGEEKVTNDGDLKSRKVVVVMLKLSCGGGLNKFRSEKIFRIDDF